MIADTILLGMKSRRKLTRVIHKHNVSILRKKEKKKERKREATLISFRFVLIFPKDWSHWWGAETPENNSCLFFFALVGVVTLATVTQWMRMTKRDLLQQVNKVTKSTTTVNNRGGEGPWGTLLLPFLAMITRNPPLKSPIKCLYGNTHPAPCGWILCR